MPPWWAFLRFGRPGGVVVEVVRQPRDLCQPSSQEGSLGVVAVPQTVADTRSQGDDVLERPTQLNAGQIVVGVDTEVGRPNYLLRRLSGVRVVRGHDG